MPKHQHADFAALAECGNCGETRCDCMERKTEPGWWRDALQIVAGIIGASVVLGLVLKVVQAAVAGVV